MPWRRNCGVLPMDNNRILSLLGLALRGNRLAVGEEPVEAVARARDARVLLLAADAADNTRRRVEHFADAGQCLWLRVPFTKAQLGQAVGRPSVAILAITDIGLAAAVVHRLEELDPERYGESARRLDVKARRAAERKAEQLAHEKNLRRGRRRSKAPEAPAPKAASPKAERPRPADAPSPRKSRPSKENRPKPRAKASPYANSRPVKKGKGSFRKKAQ